MRGDGTPCTRQEFKAEFPRMLDSCVAVSRENEEQDAAEADDGEAPPQVH